MSKIWYNQTRIKVGKKEGRRRKMREGERKQERRGAEEKEGKKSGVSAVYKTPELAKREAFRKNGGNRHPFLVQNYPQVI